MADDAFALFLESLPEELVKEAMSLAIQRMKLTPEKLATIFVRRINPEEHIEQREEVPLRGVDRETLKKRKDEGHYPYFINGLRTLADG